MTTDNIIDLIDDRLLRLSGYPKSCCLTSAIEELSMLKYRIRNKQYEEQQVSKDLNPMDGRVA